MDSVARRQVGVSLQDGLSALCIHALHGKDLIDNAQQSVRRRAG
jgi:hypothetical protein